jgi:hypothetical protein
MVPILINFRETAYPGNRLVRPTDGHHAHIIDDIAAGELLVHEPLSLGTQFRCICGDGDNAIVRVSDNVVGASTAFACTAKERGD